jgi:hypothetical protein
VSARIGYIFNSRYRIDGTVGYDDGDFTARNGRSSGARWELALRWTPKPTSSFRFGFGQAYYGEY